MATSIEVCVLIMTNKRVGEYQVAVVNEMLATKERIKKNQSDCTVATYRFLAIKMWLVDRRKACFLYKFRDTNMTLVYIS